MTNTTKLVKLLEKYLNTKVILKEDHNLPSFLKYNNLFKDNSLNEDDELIDRDDDEVITKPAKPIVKPKPKRPSPLTPTRPVINPKPKSLYEDE